MVLRLRSGSSSRCLRRGYWDIFRLRGTLSLPGRGAYWRAGIGLVVGGGIDRLRASGGGVSVPADGGEFVFH